MADIPQLQGPLPNVLSPNGQPPKVPVGPQQSKVAQGQQALKGLIGAK